LAAIDNHFHYIVEPGMTHIIGIGDLSAFEFGTEFRSEPNFRSMFRAKSFRLQLFGNILVYGEYKIEFFEERILELLGAVIDQDAPFFGGLESAWIGMLAQTDPADPAAIDAELILGIPLRRQMLQTGS